MLKNEGHRLSKVIVCTPRTEYHRVSDPAAHNIAGAADGVMALTQHDNLKKIMTAFGAGVVDVRELDGHPNSVFTRDTALCTPLGYVELSMGLGTRKGEPEWMAGILDRLGEPRAGAIAAPATIEGGDVLCAGDVAFVGRSSRTNDEGVKQISNILETMGYEVRTTGVPEPFLHLGGAMSVVGEETILCCGGLFGEEILRGFETIEVPPLDFSSGNVICLGERELIADSANRHAIEILAGRDFTVHAIDLSEFTKGVGGPTCLILPVERV
jgi:dimethylargininase